MSRPGERLLDAESAAAAGSVIEREFRIADFARLADRLARPEGTVNMRIALAHIDGVATAQLWVRADAQLTCQRCLGAVRRALESESELAFVSREDAPVPAGREAVAGDPHRVDLAALVEDELLLALPLIARHGAGEACALPRVDAPPATVGAGETRRPFAGLRDLLKQ